MSAFDVRKEIRERRLREAAEQKRDEPQPSAPPEAQILRPPRPPSARSSGQDFGDAESYQIHSEPDDEWYQDETQGGKHEQVSEPRVDMLPRRHPASLANFARKISAQSLNTSKYMENERECTRKEKPRHRRKISYIASR